MENLAQFDPKTPFESYTNFTSDLRLIPQRKEEVEEVKV